ncbi:DUF302 domain-containing protein [Alkalibacterium sp. 20]|uniref:DUF302 domain-containing protein n=1 Tax=Alkalibacterium sp. 20 TaxID=1798803 RepID=UPI00090009D2|nr:DUF302 domain-containing protein [Alkalibacterium sp. 20]OJF94555.1 hypothetical protein AX762_01425 [Alkalibacterium sp. 20]
MNYAFEEKSSRSYAETLEKLKQAITDNSFGVLYEVNLKDKIEGKGFDFANNFTVLEVCNPKLAKEVLDEQIEAGYFLPCKVVVYEKENAVYAGVLKPTVLIDMVGNDSLHAAAVNVEEILVKAVKSAV